jgi:hypothetical protein
MANKTMIEIACFLDGSFTCDLGATPAHSHNVRTARKRAKLFRSWGWSRLPSIRAKDVNERRTTTSVWAIPA